MNKSRLQISQSLAVAGLIAFLSACDSSGQPESSGATSPNLVASTGVTRYRASANDGTANTLVNPDFEEELGAIPGWIGCFSDDNIERVIGAGSGLWSMEVQGGDCVQQAVPVIAGSELTLACGARRAFADDGWGGLGISFYDEDFNFISEPEAAYVGDDNRSNGLKEYKVSGTAPYNAKFVGIWFYTETRGYLDACSLTTGGDYVEPGKRDFNRSYYLAKSRLPMQVDGFIDRTPPSYYRYGMRGVNENLIDGGLSENSANRYADFQVAHDGERLYIYTSISKPARDFERNITGARLYQDSFPSNGRLWDDDSFEIYINAGGENTIGYDSNDFLKMFGFSEENYYIPVDLDGDNSRVYPGYESSCITSEYSGTQCEVGINLAELGIDTSKTTEIGFDIHWNFDDDGGNREAHYSWCSGETLNAWRDMSTIGCSLILNQ